MPPSSENRKLPLPESGAPAEQPFEVRSTETGRCLIARRNIAAGTRLFGEDDFADEAERRSFRTLSEAQLRQLAPAERAAFVRFGYNTAPDEITGALDLKAVRHPTNFLNHCCDPNAGYDGTEHIVALREIAAGEEIRMDYGTFSFSFDHDFVCRCGAANCRGKVTANDWPNLVRRGLRLPGFMRERADRLS
jgi:SET domain-containing protein